MTLRSAAAAAGLAAGAYAAYAASTWVLYGQATRVSATDEDSLLDRFMPRFEVAERHHIGVDAPAEATLAAARDVDLFESPVARAIFRARERILGATPPRRATRRGLLAETQALGWVVLAEVPGREIVVGAVTRPWEANVTFRSIPPEKFASFNEPGYIKIAWTLRADPVDESTSVFRTETRAAATDPTARATFRRYWSLLSPGIIVIRWVMLRPVKAAAERRWHAERAVLHDADAYRVPKASRRQ